jgi:hypothetical protein
MVSVYPRLQEPSVKPAKPDSAQPQPSKVTLSSTGDDRTQPEPEHLPNVNPKIFSTYHLERRTFL